MPGTWLPTTKRVYHIIIISYLYQNLIVLIITPPPPHSLTNTTKALADFYLPVSYSLEYENLSHVIIIIIFYVLYSSSFLFYTYEVRPHTAVRFPLFIPKPIWICIFMLEYYINNIVTTGNMAWRTILYCYLYHVNVDGFAMWRKVVLFAYINVGILGIWKKETLNFEADR